MDKILESSRATYANLTEIYEVVKTVEIVKDGKTRYRLDVTKCYNDGLSPQYDVSCWRREDFNIQPSYSRSGDKFEKTPEDAELFVRGHMPALNATTAEQALQMAIRFLATGDL